MDPNKIVAPKPKRFTKKRLFFIIFILLIMIGGGVAAYFAFFSDGPMGSDKSSNSSQQTANNQAPTQDLMTVITGNAALSKFGQLLTASGVKFTLQTLGTNYLVLAFNNSAADNLPSGYFDSLLGTDKQTVAQGIAKYLVALQPTAELSDGQHLKMLSGQEVIVVYKEGRVAFTDSKGHTASVVGGKSSTTNGTLYVLDSVLLPQ
jgi:uncharacterized surface protein with fasciclin (FAS1) repeats